MGLPMAERLKKHGHEVTVFNRTVSRAEPLKNKGITVCQQPQAGSVSNMTMQQLIYENVVPVTSARHGKSSVEVGADYLFTRNLNSVPLTAVEIPQAAAEFAIVFAGNAEAVLPVVILGARSDENPRGMSSLLS